MKKIRRYKRMMRRSLFTLIRARTKGMRLAKHNPTIEEAYEAAVPFLKIYHKRLKVNILIFGKEYLDTNINGCLLMGNHQSPGDCQVVLECMSQTKFYSSYIINAEKSKGFLNEPVFKIFKAKGIKFDDLRSQLKVYNEMTEEISNEGRRFIVFPEAGYSDNKNNLQEWNTPCFMPAIKSKCPIIPFCLYDTWRIFYDDTLKSVDVECHILKPIFYDEYKDLNKKELAELVKSRVAAKMGEIKSGKDIE